MATEYKVPENKNAVPAGKSWVSDKPGRYQLTEDRFFDGVVVEGARGDRRVELELVKASPEFPVVIKLPAGSKIDPGLRQLAEGEEAEPVKLKPAHAGEAIKKRGAAAHFGRILKSQAQDEADDA